MANIAPYMFTYKIISNSSRKFSIHTRVRCRSMYTRLALEYSRLPKSDPQPRSFFFNIIQHEQAVHCSFLFLTWRKLEFIPLKSSIFICRESFQWKSVHCCSVKLNPLLMTTYRQDVMTNFGCVHNRSSGTYLPIFQGSFPKYTQVYLSNNFSC